MSDPGLAPVRLEEVTGPDGLPLWQVTGEYVDPSAQIDEPEAG